MSQQITCARIALRRHGGPMQDENGCACEHCVALRELIDMVRARPALPAPEPPRKCGSCGGALRETATATIGYSHWVCDNCGLIAQEGEATPQPDLSGDYDWVMAILRQLEDATLRERHLLGACLVAGGVRAPSRVAELSKGSLLHIAETVATEPVSDDDLAVLRAVLIEELRGAALPAEHAPPSPEAIQAADDVRARNHAMSSRKAVTELMLRAAYAVERGSRPALAGSPEPIITDEIRERIDRRLGYVLALAVMQSNAWADADEELRDAVELFTARYQGAKP